MDKVYITLFTCCVTRAAHLELVEDLEAVTFRTCIRKFIARRGMPSLIVSDNAKTFQATQEALSRSFNYPEVRSYLSDQRLEWKFNPEKAPWWGGVRLSYDEFITVLVEVEATINCRPLTYEYNEEDGEVSTPSHLIYGRCINNKPDEIVEPGDARNEASCSARFKNLSSRLAHF